MKLTILVGMLLSLGGMMLSGNAWALDITPNPGFETNNGTDAADGWRLFVASPGDATLQVVTGADAYEGTSAMRVTKTAANGDVVFDNWDAPADVMNNSLVNVTFYLRDSASSSTQVEAHLFTMDASNNWIGDLGSITVTLGNTWQAYTISTGMTNVAAAKIGLACRINGLGTFDIDAVTMERTDALESGNIIRNPSMEDYATTASADYWRFGVFGGNGSGQVITGAHTGSAAFRMVRNDASGDVVFDMWDSMVPVVGGSEYTVECWLRDPNALGAQVEFHVIQADNYGNWIGDAGSTTVDLVGTYKWSQVSVTLDANARYAGLAFRVVGAGTVDIDDIGMGKGSEVPVQLSGLELE